TAARHRRGGAGGGPHGQGGGAGPPHLGRALRLGRGGRAADAPAPPDRPAPPARLAGGAAPRSTRPPCRTPPGGGAARRRLPGGVAYQVAQLFGATGPLEAEVGGLVGAAALSRFRGEPPGAAYLLFGRRLRAGGAPLPPPAPPGAAALSAEREEIVKAEDLLA